MALAAWRWRKRLNDGVAGAQPPTGRVPPRRTLADRVARRRLAAIAGHERDAATARSYLDDPDPDVRATALQALARCGTLDESAMASAVRDPAPIVRRRAAELLATECLSRSVVALLRDSDPTVVEVAAWAAGERYEEQCTDGVDPLDDIVEGLSTLAGDHVDPLVREAAVAALGAIGAEAGLPAILGALDDRAPIRRRAVIALTPFDGTQVAAALERARSDRDWQVAQLATELGD